MIHATRNVIESFKPDLVHCNCMMLGDLALLASARLVRAIAPENVESLLVARMASTTDTRLRRVLYTREAKLIRRWETSHLAAFDLCLGVSDGDTRAFADLGANAICVPNGVARHPMPPPVATLRDDEPLKLLLVGDGGSESSRVGLVWFVNDVIPRLRCRISPRLTVVGAGWDWLDHPMCNVIGHVPSVAPYYESHHAALVPQLSGGGSRLKVAEALAKGVPVVGTSVALEGYSLQPDVHALFGDTPDELAACIHRLDVTFRSDIEAVRCQVAAGFDLVQRFFWDEIGAQLVEVYRETLSRKRAAVKHLSTFDESPTRC